MILIGIPAYNEGKQIYDIVSRAKPYADNVIVVNDGSYDDTEIKAKSAGAIVINHAQNMGVGASIKTIFQYARPLLNHEDILITLDGDGQHEPEDIPKLLAKLNEGYDIVNGSRFYPRTLQRGLDKYHTILNYIASRITRMLSGYNIQDSESGFRAHKSWTIEKMKLKSDDYGWNSEALIRLSKMNAKLAEVPINTTWGIVSLGHKRRGFWYGSKILIRLLMVKISQ